MNLDTRERGGGTGGLNMMTDYCTQGSLQTRPNESLNICEQMNLTERIAIASTFHLLSRNSLMLEKQTSDRKSFINTTNYGNNIYLDKIFAFA